MQKRIFVLSAIGLIATLGCSDDPAVAAPGGAAGMVTAGGMAVTGTSGVGAAGVGAAGTGATVAGTGPSAAGTSAAGTGAAAGSGAAGSGAAGSGAAGMGMGAAGMAAAGATGAAAGTSGAAGGGAEAGTGGAAGGGGGAFTLTSSAVMEGQMLPVKYRCNGGVGGPTGPNPPFAWSGAPAGTMSFALIMRDRTFNNYQHWTIYDIPASTTSLPEGVPTGAMPAMPAGAKQATNSAGLTGPGYYGPCGASGMNNYEFKLYALDVATLPMAGMSGASVETALGMHDLATTSLMITSGPPM